MNIPSTQIENHEIFLEALKLLKKSEIWSFQENELNEKFNFLNMKELKNFISALDPKNNFEKSLELLKMTHHVLSNPKISWYELDNLILTKLIHLIQTDDNLMITGFTLAKTKAGPNYDMLPKIKLEKLQDDKIQLEKLQYQYIIEILFINHNPALSLIKNIEYFRQKGIGFDKFLIMIIKTTIINWLKLNEPKTLSWFENFMIVSKNNYKDDFSEICNMFEI
jgi:hypothetical protein